MARINLNMFRGERPNTAPHLLPNEYATVAKNANFDRGILAPYKAPLGTLDPIDSSIKTLFRYQNQYWFKWDSKVDAVLSPIAQDPWGRVYYTGDGYPKLTNNIIFQGPANSNLPAAYYRLGVPAGTDKLTATVIPPDPLPGDDTKEDDETRFYVYTFVTESGEEGPPSPVTDQIEIAYPGSIVQLTIPAMPTQTSNIKKRRIYRSVTGGGVADFFLVAEVAPSLTTYSDSRGSEELGMPLESEGYEMPNENLAHLTLMPNGIMAGGYDNNVCFSEPYLPHAWNPGYQQTTEHDIVAMASVGNVLIVATEGYPWMFQGVSPDAMTGRKLPSKQACVSKRSMQNIDNMIIYASPKGLVAFNGQDMINVTEDVIDEETWASLEPDTIEAYYYNGKYLAFYGQALDKSFIFNPAFKDIIFFDIGTDCGFTDLIDGRFYLKDNGHIAVWNQGQPKTFTFRSKEYQVLYSSFSTGYVLSDDNSLVALKVIVDGQVIKSYPAGKIKNGIFRIPPKRGNVWQFEVTSQVNVTRVCLATSVAEVYG
ncbi:hypothetical protein [Vibrio sp. ER1A]|uniref:hypothetical protein n=1 Tax=Vibrio sp. ER1A TaxID=1517681 RepID=UPI0004DCE284|nr:hypothetical protein [Vibrio sp. ER1A]KFA99481.1 hypothetical protein HW45_03735 [Vibrio sp. ER1A]